MGILVWAMVGLALWHFTIFLPDHFWGGIVGALLGALLGSIIVALIINTGSIPGRNQTDIGTALEAIPGAVIGLALVYWRGTILERREARASA
jgi:hypothetical protein